MFYFNEEYDSPIRYDLAKFVEFNVDMFDVLSSYFMEELRNLEPAGVFIVQTEEGRLDLISYKIYGSTQYWWVIAEYNKIYDPTQVVSGVSLLYPSLSDLEELYFRLKALERGLSQ